MKSLYESIKNIMTEAPAQPAPGSPAARSQERGQALKNFFKGDDKASADTTPKPAGPAVAGKPVGTRYGDKDRSLLDMIRDKPTKTGSGASGFPVQPSKDTTLATKVDKPTKQPSKNPTVTAKPKADNAPTSNDVSKPAASDATSLAKAQGKEVEDKPSDTGTDDRAARAMASSSKRASILPADTMQKNLDQARKNLDNMMGNDDDEDSKPQASKVETPKEEEPKAETPKASDKDYSTGRPADKELDDKYGKGNTRTDAEGRTYVRQKGVMGQPDTENRSYASVGDFINKIRGKGDVNGKVTAKEAYINKTFGISNDLTASIMEVLKKKESSAPRNDKEQDLAAHYGDPKRITHGDVLVARGVINQKKLKEGSLEDMVTKASDSILNKFPGGRAEVERTKKYQADFKKAKEDGTEVPTPPSGFAKPKKIKESLSRRLAYNALSRVVEAKKDDWVDSDDKDDDEYQPKAKPMGTQTSPKATKPANAPKRASILPADTMQKNAARARKNLDNMMTDTNESKDTPGNSYEHQCAIHVRSESFGEGRTVTTQHADPDHNGDIAWYDVMFEHGIEKYVPTAELEILVSEMHMHSKRKKTVKEAAEEDEYAPESAKAKRKAAADMGAGADKPAPDAQAAPSKQGSAAGYAPSPEVANANASPKPAAAAPSAGNEAAKTGIAAGSPAISGAAPANNMKNAGDVLRAAQQGKNSNTVEAPKPAEKAEPQVNNQSSGYNAQSQAQKSPDPVNNQSSGYNAQSQAQKSPDAAEKPAAAAPAQATAAPKPGATTTAADGRTYTTQKGVMGQPDTQQRSYASIGDFLNKIRGKGDVNGKVAPAQASATEKPADNNQSSGYSAQSQAQKSPDAVNNQSSGYSAQSQAQKSPDAAAKPAGAPTAPPGQAAMSYAGKGADSGSTAQASSTPAPAGESPEEKAKKAAAKQPQRSFQGQGMVGTDF